MAADQQDGRRRDGHDGATEPPDAGPDETESAPGAAGRDDPPHEPEPEQADDEDDEREDEEEDEPSDLPPPPDAGPLHIIPIRHLPLAHDAANEAEPAEAGPLRAPAETGARGRTWNWVPLGALVSLVTTTLISFLLTLAMPGIQDATKALGDSITGVEGDAERLAAVEAILTGPQGEAIQQALIAMAVSFVAGLLLAGLLAGFFRSGAFEAGLGTATFALLSLLFMGGGFSPYTLVTPLFAFGVGWAGARLGRWLRRKRDERIVSAGLR